MRNAAEAERLLDEWRAQGQNGAALTAQLAELCLGWPYVFGAWGEACTPQNRGRRVRSDHPAIRENCRVLCGRAGGCGGCRWQGTRMFDCRGFVYWCLLQGAGLRLSGGGATSQWNHRPNWDARGERGSRPDCVCALFQRSGGMMRHTGLHIGGGRVIHCAAGVQEGLASDRAWTHWAVPKGLYTAEALAELLSAPVTAEAAPLRRGSRGEAVRRLQLALNAGGWPCGAADGIFGAKTMAAVRAFQAAAGLASDGIAGPLTLAALRERGLYA